MPSVTTPINSDSPNGAQCQPAPASIEIGASECDVVRVEGVPDDLLVGGSSSAKREAQLLYARPQGKVIYLFSDNRLTRVVR